MNELSSPVSIESDNTLGDVIDSYGDDPPSDGAEGGETSGMYVAPCSG